MRSVMLVSILFLITLVCSGWSATYTWSDSGNDHDWNNAIGWGGSPPPGTNDPADWGIIRQGYAKQYGANRQDPVISAPAPTCFRIKVGDNVNTAGTAELTINDGGSLTVTSRLDVSDYTNSGYVAHTGILHMNGGSLSTPTFTVGRVRSYGILYMKGGAITTTTFVISDNNACLGGYVYLDGGTITCNTLTMNNTGLLDVTLGTLTINANVKNIIDGHVTAGRIKAFGGAGTVIVDNTTEPGKTIVSAAPYYKAYSPIPVDGAEINPTAIGDVVLGWLPGAGAIEHHVYFGISTTDVTNGTGGTDKGTTAELEYDPRPLEFDTTYYWKIDESDGVNTTAGNLWTFKTEPNIVAEMASNPIPADLSTGVSRLVTLQWTEGVGAESHDVYLGTNKDIVKNEDPSVYLGNSTEPNFTPSTLAATTTYYWKVNEINSKTYKGLVWSFTTGSPSGDVMWDNGEPNNANWNMPANWNTDQVPTVDKNTVYIKAGGATEDPFINSTVPDIEMLYMGHSTGVGLATLTLEEGASLTVQGPRVRMGEYLGSPTDLIGAELIINGGSMTVKNAIDIGSKYCDGFITMTGGSLKVGDLRLAAAPYNTSYINLNGGVLETNTYVFTQEPARERESRIDIGGGTLILAGNKTTDVKNWIDGGYLTAYGSYNGALLGDPNFIAGGHPRASLFYDYDVTNPGKTTVWAYMPDPATAYGPEPANQATNVDIFTNLSWMPGDGAVSHSVYIGTDPEALEPLQADLSETACSAGDLLGDTTYYWRVDEFDGTEIHTGSVWSFTTSLFSTLKDFDPDDPNTWQESAVGGAALTRVAPPILQINLPTNDPNAFRALKMTFNNTGGAYQSEAVLMYTPAASADLTRSYGKSLYIPLHGALGNAAEPVYLKITDADAHSYKLVHEDTADLIVPEFEDFFDAWNVDLAIFTLNGVDLTRVVSIAIGVGDGVAPGGAGTLYVDDIRLYQSRCIYNYEMGDLDGDCIIDVNDLPILANNWLAVSQTVTAAEPGTDALLAYWKFNGNAEDETGNYDGAIMSAGFDASGGHDGGGCLVLDGVAGRVEIPAAAALFSSIFDKFTASYWVNVDKSIPQMQRQVLFTGGDAFGEGHLFMSSVPNGLNIDFESGYYTTPTQGDPIRFTPMPSQYRGNWAHIAVTKDASAGIQKMYMNGELVAQTTGSYLTLSNISYFIIGGFRNLGDPRLMYKGRLDDFRIYNTVLSHAEILSLANVASVTVPATADINANDKVDLNDFAIIGAHWLGEALWP